MFSVVLLCSVGFLTNSALESLLSPPNLIAGAAAAGLLDIVLRLPRPVVRVITGHLALGGQHGLLDLGHCLRLLPRLRVPGVTHVTGQDGHGGLLGLLRPRVLGVVAAHVTTQGWFVVCVLLLGLGTGQGEGGAGQRGRGVSSLSSGGRVP